MSKILKTSYALFLAALLTACSPYKDGNAFVQALNDNGYFSRTDSASIKDAQTHIADVYNQKRQFEGYNALDGRYYSVDTRLLFENNGIVYYLTLMEPMLQQQGLSLELTENNVSDSDPHNYKHTIRVNGIEYTLFEGKANTMIVLAVAFANFGDLINDQLQRNGIKERAYLMGGGVDAAIVFLDESQYQIIKKGCKDNDYLPRTVKDWKDYFQLAYNAQPQVI